MAATASKDPKKRLILAGADLGNAHLEHADLQSAHLEKADLSNAHMEGVFLLGANLEKANLSNAHIERANLFKAYLKGANLKNAHLEKADLGFVYLERANLGFAHLENAFLMFAQLEGAHLFGAHLEGATLVRACLNHANLMSAHLNGANLMFADLRGAQFTSTHVEGVRADLAIVDGETFLLVEYDRKSNFSGVGLDAARVAPKTLVSLKRNIREIERKEEWDKKRFDRWITQWLLYRPFWWMSDYGSSTSRIFATFFIVSVLFAGAYCAPHLEAPTWHFWPTTADEPFVLGLDTYELETGETGQLKSGSVLLRSFYLSVVTMTTLGFGDITANPLSSVGHWLVMCQVFIGYIILGALITRLAIMFQEVG